MMGHYDPETKGYSCKTKPHPNPPQPPATPAMTREEMIEKANTFIQNSMDLPWKERAEQLVDKLHPELAPNPPEPVKTANENIAERVVQVQGRVIYVAAHADTPFVIDGGEMLAMNLRAAITALLDARDAQHQRELEALRERCALEMQATGYPLSATRIRAVPLTTPEDKR